MPGRADVPNPVESLADRLPSRAVLVFYLYSLSRAAAFTVPIYVLFYRARGLSLAQFGVLEATYTLAVLGFEFPTGYLADRIGRRNGLAAGNALSALGAVGYALAHSFPAFLLAVAVRGVGATFVSGASDAWLYEVLADADAEAEFARVSGRARALGLAGRAGAAVVGSWAYGVSHLLPWALDALALAGGVVLLLVAVPAGGRRRSSDARDDHGNSGRTSVNDGEDDGKDSNHNERDGLNNRKDSKDNRKDSKDNKNGSKDNKNDGEDDKNGSKDNRRDVQNDRKGSDDNESVVTDEPDPTDDRFTVAEAIEVARTALTRPGLRSFVAYTALFLGVASSALLFVQPVSVDVAGIDPARLGVVYAGLTLVSAGAASQAGRAKTRLGVGDWFRVAPLLAAAGLLAVLVAPVVAVPLFFLLRALAAVSRPLADGQVNDAIESRGRATVLSGVSMLRSVAVAPLKLLAGAIAVAALPEMLAALGAVLLVGSAAILLVGRPIGYCGDELRETGDESKRREPL